MRKLIFLLFCVFLSNILTAQEPLSPDFSTSPVIIPPVEGEYVMYRNTLEDEEKIYTIIFLEENRYFMHIRNLATGEVHELDLTLGVEDGLYKITKILLVSGESESPDIKHAQIDLFNILIHRMNQDVSSFPDSFIAEQIIPEYKYVFLYDYRYWVPVFNLYSRSLAGYPGKQIKLLRFGRVDVNNMKPLLEFSGVDEDVDNSPVIALDEAEPQNIVYDNITIRLDSHWSDTGNNTAVIEKDGKVYAYIRILSFSKSTFNPNPYVYFSQNLLNSVSYILPVTVVVDRFKAYPLMKYVEYDEEEQSKTQIIVFFYDRGEGISILQFGASKNFYEANKEYFDKILF